MRKTTRKCVKIVGLTISNFQMSILRFSLWKHSLQFVGNGSIYSVGKDLVKQNTTFCQKKSFVSTSHDSLSRETLAKASRLAWLFIFQSCALHVALSRVSFLWDTRKIHLFILLSLSLHTLWHSSLTIETHMHIGENDWRNYNQIWHEIKVNTK